MNLMRRKEERNIQRPFDLLRNFEEEMSRLFNTSLTNAGREFGLFSPDIDVRVEDNEVIVHADLPGINKENLNVSITDNILSIRGERKEEKEKKNKNFYQSERWYGSFERMVELPVEVDASKTKASFKDGVLELSIARNENAKPRQIQIEVK